jgi:alanyl-tRNA synthetase
VRAGGKHNDLDNVGYTARHLTFFEMLGNFSFGDYYKADAIAFAWDLITKDFALDPKRLMATIYEDDDEARDLWRKVTGFPDSKIVRLGAKSNFWQMGDTGPCGPNSEIFFDHGDKVAGGPPGSPDEDGDRFVEIWNLVFMQFEQLSSGERIKLPKPSVDTGMGLERMATVLQGVHDIYDIDLLKRLIETSAELAKTPANGPHAVSHRVVSDHLRSSAFLITDGVLPSNEGRGYVLRRIMRRAMRHAHIMGAREPLMWRLVPTLVAEMGAAYPDLLRAQALITETLKLEETRFRQTLERGLKLLDEEIGRLGGAKTLPGDLAFKLYDTYGFPLDLTQDALRAKGIDVDTQGFAAAMERQRAEARKAWAGSGEAATDAIWFGIKDELGATEFLGYDTEVAEGQIVAMFVDGKRVTEITAGQEAQILTNQTPFYGESGGQVGDAGVIFSSKGGEFSVSDTQKKLGLLHIHVGKVTHGTFRVGDAVELRVDSARRRATRANHSATHLLNAALKHVLGPHISQKGSLVAPDRLRFDFSHPKAMTAEEIARVEEDVNRVVAQNEDVQTRVMPTNDAIAAGAVAMFGEKYGEEVRVLTMGVVGDKGAPFSVELCGGTHVRRLGDIGLFKIIGESAVAAGVRRVEALTGEGARAFANQHIALARETASVLKTNPAELPARVAALMDERRRLERELVEAKRALALSGGGGDGQAKAASDVAEVGGVKVIARVVDGVAAKDLRSLVDEGKQKVGSGVVAFVTTADGKATVAIGVTDDLTKRISAVDLIKKAVEAVGGKGGGGRPDMAQGGGPDAAKASHALEAVKRSLGELAGTA